MPDVRLWNASTDIGRYRFYFASMILLVAIVIVVRPTPLAFPLDDAYITIHNAQALLSGTDRNYGVSPLVGATSEIHLLLVTAMMSLTQPLAASFLVDIAAALLYAIGLARIAFQLGASYFVAALFVALGLLTGYAPYQLLNGLETGLAMAAVTWALSFALNPSLSVALPILCGLLPFVRPELGALSCVLLARQTWLRIRLGERAHAARDGAIALCVAMPFLIWMWWSVGSPISQTASAKQWFFAEQGAPWKAKSAVMLGGFAQAGLLPLVGIACLAHRSRLWKPVCVYIFALVVAWFAFFPSGVTHNFSRYLYDLLPALLCVTLDYLRTSRLAVPWLIVLTGWLALSLPGAWRAYQSGDHFTDGELTSLAQWLNTNLPARSKILVHDAGYLAYATPFQLVDVVGLKTPQSMAFHRACTAPTNGRDRQSAVSAIATTSGVRYAVVLHDAQGYWYALKHDLDATGWTLRELRAPLEPNGYGVYALTPPTSTSHACDLPGHALATVSRAP